MTYQVYLCSGTTRISSVLPDNGISDKEKAEEISNFLNLEAGTITRYYAVIKVI